MGSLKFFLDLEQTADQDEDHLIVHVHDVFPHAEDNSSQLSRDGDGVLGVVGLLLIALSLHHDVPVDGTRLHCSGQFNEESAVREGLILEVLDFLIWHALVGPLNEILLSLGPDDLEVVEAD